MAEKKETKWKHLMEQTLTEHKKKKKTPFKHPPVTLLVTNR